MATGDQHFIVRYSLTGVVLLAFAMCGLWIHDVAAAHKVINFFSLNLQGLAALIATPVLGVLIQGLTVAFMYWFRDHLFMDPARKEVAAWIREVLENHPTGIPERLTQRFQSEEAASKQRSQSEEAASKLRRLARLLRRKKRCAALPDDSLFVWMYYVDAPVHLIEWARRRRDYYYLGVNWGTAAGLGFLVGYLAPWVLPHRPVVISVSLAFLCLWIWGTLWLAGRMKLDADSMELAWACAHLYPKFGELLSSKLPPTSAPLVSPEAPVGANAPAGAPAPPPIPHSRSRRTA